MSIKDYSLKYICAVCNLKLRFYCVTCSAMSNMIQLISKHQQSSEVLILKVEMLLEFQNKANFEINGP